jgi:transposase
MMPTGMTVMLAVEPVNLSRSFDGLAAMVAERFATDPRAGRMMWVFLNRQRTALKALWRDDRGWFILGRRLDDRVLALPRGIPAGARSVNVDTRTLALLLEGTESGRRETRRSVAHAARDAVVKERIKTRNHASTERG